MIVISPEKQQELDEHILAISRILYEHTEIENLKTFETIEWEVREQVLEKVTPQIGEFFFRRGRKKVREAKKCEDLLGIGENQPATGKKARTQE
jgi:hypothetical protein